MESSEDKSERAYPLWVSRLLVIVLLLWISGFGVLALIKALSVPATAQSVASPFKAWDGVWEGELATYKFTGEPVSKVKVRQDYRHVLADKEFQQEGHFEITDPKTGKTVRESALYSADFELKTIRCKIIRKNGGEVIFRTGKIEGNYLFWSRSAPSVLESFREWVEGDAHCVEGSGIYGDKATAEPVVFVGRYRKVKDDSPQRQGDTEKK